MAEKENLIPQIVAAIKQCQGKVTLAAQRLGIAPNEIRELADAHPEIKEAIDEALSYFQETAELAFERAVVRGETWAVREAVKRMGVSLARAVPDKSAAQPGAAPKRRNKLTQKQRAALTVWVAEGLRLPEINERGAQFDPPFNVEWLQLKHARTRAGKRFSELREDFEKEALAEGLARKAIRIREIVALYNQHMALIKARGKEMTGEVAGGDTGLMARDYKGKDADRAVYKYDAPLIKEMRGLLDDIAKELGERKNNVDLTTGGELILKVQYGDDGAKSNADNSIAEAARSAKPISE